MRVETVRIVNTVNPEEEIIVNAADVSEIVYSTQKTGFQAGKRYGNPRLFQKAFQTVSKVYVVGKWPNIVKAYQTLGIPVVLVDEKDAYARPAKPFVEKVIPLPVEAVPLPAIERTADAVEVEIPEDFRSLKWFALRSLAKKVSNFPAINSQQAIEVIEAELERRSQ